MKLRSLLFALLTIIFLSNSNLILADQNINSREMISRAQEILRELKYYDGPIDGRMTAATQKAIGKFQDQRDLTETRRLDLATTEALGLNIYTVSHDAERVIMYDLDSPDAIKVAQKTLFNQNYYDGPINGEMTVSTQEAIKSFQQEHRMTVTGLLDRPTAEKLGLKPVVIPYKEGLKGY